MKKIRILMISSSGELGGGPILIHTLGNGLGQEFEVFYAIPKNKLFQKLSIQKDKIINISERKITFFDLVNLIKFIDLKLIDIIHAHGKGAGFISRIIKIFVRKPLIYSFHGIHLKCLNSFQKLTYISLENLSGFLDTYKVLSSKSEKLYAEKSNIRLGKNNLIINNGVKNKKIKSYLNWRESNKKNFKKEKIKILSICRFVKQKNVSEIVELSKILPNFNFFIIGYGPLFEKIRLKKERYGLQNLFLLGKQTNILKYLYESDLYLSTSLYEGHPISILEAMSIGLPIIATNVTGNNDTIVHGESGFFYELGSIQEASKYIKLISKNINLLKAMGTKSYERQRQKFSVQEMCSNTSNLYKKIYKDTLIN